MTARHTAGPWAVTDPRDGHRTLAITARSGAPEAEDVAEVSVWREDLHPNQRANARLIAAAPDLLALLKAIEAELSDQEDVVDGRDGQPSPNWAMRLLGEFPIRSVIAKAEGKP